MVWPWGYSRGGDVGGRGRKEERHRQWNGGKREREREGEDETVFDFVIDHQEITQLTQYMCIDAREELP